MCGDVALQLHLSTKGLPAEDALVCPGQIAQVAIFDMHLLVSLSYVKRHELLFKQLGSVDLLMPLHVAQADNTLD